MFRKSLAILCAVSLYSGPVQAVTQSDINTAIAQINTDSQLISTWMTGQLRKAVAFNSTSGAVVPQQLKLFGFEIGVEGVVSNTKVDAAGFRALPTSVIDTDSIDVEKNLPFPAVIAHAKIGLPFGLDAGVRVGGIPEKDFDSGDTRVEVENKIFGIDVRKKLIEEGLTRPFGLTVGASYTHAEGHIDATTPYDSNLGTTVVGSASFESTLDAVGANHSEWDTNSLGLQAILNKKIAFVNPYVGTSIHKNSGSISNTLTTAGTVTLTDVSNSANTTSSAVSTSATASDGPKSWDIRALAGIEFSILPFMRLGLHGEYAGSRNLAGALGLRVQFR